MLTHDLSQHKRRGSKFFTRRKKGRCHEAAELDPSFLRFAIAFDEKAEGEEGRKRRIRVLVHSLTSKDPGLERHGKKSGKKEGGTNLELSSPISFLGERSAGREDGGRKKGLQEREGRSRHLVFFHRDFIRMRTKGSVRKREGRAERSATVHLSLCRRRRWNGKGGREIQSLPPLGDEKKSQEEKGKTKSVAAWPCGVLAGLRNREPKREEGGKGRERRERPALGQRQLTLNVMTAPSLFGKREKRKKGRKERMGRGRSTQILSGWREGESSGKKGERSDSPSACFALDA